MLADFEFFEQASLIGRKKVSAFKKFYDGAASSSLFISRTHITKFFNMEFSTEFLSSTLLSMLKKMTYSFNTYDVKDVLLSIAAVVLLVKEALLVGSVELKAFHYAQKLPITSILSFCTSDL